MLPFSKSSTSEVLDKERNIHLLRLLDEAALLFNSRPRDGIAFMVKNKLSSEEPADLASFLLRLGKVDKVTLGVFLGKDNELSISILNKFASLFNYAGVEIDEALRLFTSRFVMPGESQMVYRILERFSVYYSQANLQVDKDKAHILTYAIIMLNVDAHSEHVKVRMTRDQFVKNCQSAVGGVISQASLEGIYNRIVAQELKPDTSAEEVVYSKLAMNPKYVSGTLITPVDVNVLKKGATFIKYGRQGTSHPRKVFLSDDGKRVCWCDPESVHPTDRLDVIKAAIIKLRSKGTEREDTFVRHILLDDIVGLVVGTGGSSISRKNFKQRLGIPPEVERRCFSIIAEHRSLDLQAPQSIDIGPWIQFFHTVLSEKDKRLRESADVNRKMWKFSQEELTRLTRWQEIVPNWPEHWNCGAGVSVASYNRQVSVHPKEELLSHRMFLVNTTGYVLDRGQRLETAISSDFVKLWMQGIPSAVRSRVWPIAAGNRLRIDEKWFSALRKQILPQIYETNEKGVQDKVRAMEREMTSSSMRRFCNRALTWIEKRGSREQQIFFKVIDWDEDCVFELHVGSGGNSARYSMRPAAPRARGISTGGTAGDAPEMPQQPALQPLVRTVSTARKGGATSSGGENLIATHSFDESSSKSMMMRADTWDSDDDAPMADGWENLHKAIRLMLTSFFVQRPDINYERGIAQIAAMIILNCGLSDLTKTYTVFSNILHQFFFLDFFTLRWRDMRMRFDLFEKLLKERLPYLDDHFSCIQITSDLYLLPWFLNGFTRALPFRAACRVWDGILLLGESHFFTVALGFLQYNEHVLMTSGFSGCLELLLGHTDEVLFNDAKFFECVQAQTVATARHAAWISAQRLSEEKTTLYDLLLICEP